MKYETICVSTIRKYRQMQQQHLVTNNNNSISSKNKKRRPIIFSYFRDNNGKQVIDFLLTKKFHIIYIMDDVSLSLRNNMKSNNYDNNQHNSMFNVKNNFHLLLRLVYWY